ncbi:MAG: transketolase family protein [bacterium]|nr:transketolase family protein [bacterium]
MAELMVTRDAYGKTLVKLGQENQEIIVLDADCSSSTRTSVFREAFPDRFINFGVAEANMIGFAAGLATCGKIVFASTFAVFGSSRVFDQVRTSIAWPKLNVKIVVTHAGISVGEDGASHQAIEDIALMRSLANMTVIVPADGIETEKAIIACTKVPGPFYIRLGRAKFPIVFSNDYEFKIGQGIILRDGKDATIIAIGLMVFEALQAADELKKEGITVRVINMSTIKPIDKELIIQAAQDTRAIVTCEEHSIIGGLGSAVAEVLVENCPVPMKRIGVPDRFGFSATPDELLERFGMKSTHIVKAVKEIL